MLVLVFALLAGCSGDLICASRFRDDVAAVTGLPEKYRAEAAAQALADSCALPPAAVEALRSLPSVPPDYRPMIDLKLATDDPAAWTEACPAGPAALVAVSQTGDRSALWEACELERLGVFSKQDLKAAKVVVAPIVAAHALQRGGAPELEARWVVRMLAGLPLK